MTNGQKQKKKEITMDKVVSIRMNGDLLEMINTYKDKFQAKTIGETIRFLLEENSKLNESMDMKLRRFFLMNQINLSIEKLINKNNNVEVLKKLDNIIELLEEFSNDNQSN